MRRRKVVSAAFTGVAVTGIAGLTAAPAFAGAGGWTVTGGGHYTAKNNTVVDKFIDVTRGVTIGCTKSAVKAEGNILNSRSRLGKSIGNVSHYSPGKGAGLCSALGIIFSGVNFTTFHLNAISQKSNGMVGATITNIGVKFKGKIGGSSCVVSVGGQTPSAAGTYNNTTGLLDIFAAGTTVSHVTSKCPLIKSGDHISLSAPITITNSTGGHPQINDP